MVAYADAIPTPASNGCWLARLGGLAVSVPTAATGVAD
jgi:hypothetical protein